MKKIPGEREEGTKKEKEKEENRGEETEYIKVKSVVTGGQSPANPRSV